MLVKNISKGRLQVVLADGEFAYLAVDETIESEKVANLDRLVEVGFLAETKKETKKQEKTEEKEETTEEKVEEQPKEEIKEEPVKEETKEEPKNETVTPTEEKAEEQPKEEIKEEEQPRKPRVSDVVQPPKNYKKKNQNK